MTALSFQILCIRIFPVNVQVGSLGSRILEG
jgi:hypothetical protein